MDTHDAPTTGLMVVDHGSRRTEANRMHEQLVAMVADLVPYDVVQPAHMELAEPSIATAFERCVQAGVGLVVVSPYFLHPGRHWVTDIPRFVKDAARDHPGVEYLVTAPLGLHPLMAQVVASRVEHCLAQARGHGPMCDVCDGQTGCAIRTGDSS